MRAGLAVIRFFYGLTTPMAALARVLTCMAGFASVVVVMMMMMMAMAMIMIRQASCADLANAIVRDDGGKIVDRFLLDCGSCQVVRNPAGRQGNIFRCPHCWAVR